MLFEMVFFYFKVFSSILIITGLLFRQYSIGFVYLP